MNKKIRAKDGKLDLSEFMNDNDLNAYFKRQAKEYIDPDEDKSLLTDKNRYFHELNLIDPIIHALSDLGYRHPTPIQIKTIPVALKKKGYYSNCTDRFWKDCCIHNSHHSEYIY